MKKSVFFLFLLFISLKLPAQYPAPLQVQEYKLSNGMTVWINEDHSQPKAFGAVVVKAGSKDSPDTGIAHYFEHIMFKGTNKIGTIDYTAEKVYLDSIAMKYDELAETSEEEKRKMIQKEINELSIKASDYAIPNEFDRLISQYGGSSLNAFTSYDLTAYHNTFSPQYFHQWAELNSERFINPVFRLFQSELETVYEEKTMYNDSFLSMAMDKLLERVFKPHPYMYSVLGSTENLKNPSLSEMRAFYNDYYVAGNMGLILSGDIYASEILPIIEKTFGRIRSGEAPQKTYPQPAKFNGEESFEIKVPIPLVKARGLIWRGVPDNHEDQILLQIISRLMNNANGTGYLDKLMDDRDVLASMLMNMELNDAGVIAAVAIPKLMLQSNKKANKLVMEQIERIKKGDFTEEEVGYIKTELKKENLQQLEKIDSRALQMMMVYSQGKTWKDYLAKIEKIDGYAKKDIVNAANKYFTDDYLKITKKTGNYPKDNLQKPGFKPVIPKYKDAESEYAKELENIPLTEARPKFIDFDKDAKIIQMTDKVTLYVTQNPINDIFSLQFVFGKGSKESKLIPPMTSYLSNLGTNKYTYEEFNKELQKLGSTMLLFNDTESFQIEIQGLDENFDKTLELADHFMKNVKEDKKQLKKVSDNKKLENKAFFESGDMIADAIFEKVLYGDQSYYLNALSLKETKKLNSEELLNEFQNILNTECDIHYCGTLPSAHITKKLNKNFDVERVTVASNNPVHQELTIYNEPTIFFYNSPKAQQSIIYLYSKGEANQTQDERIAGNLFSSYFGRSMNSLVFQEIREFRSLAYGAGSYYQLANNRHNDKPGYLVGFLSTQSDKTIEAIHVMDSLIKNMPVKPERVKYARQGIINNANNNYPAFRQISTKIASLKEQGFNGDPNKMIISKVESMDINNIVEFYEKNIKNRPLVYILVGNEKNIDMEKVAEFGKIVQIEADEFYK